MTNTQTTIPTDELKQPRKKENRREIKKRRSKKKQNQDENNISTAPSDCGTDCDNRRAELN